MIEVGWFGKIPSSKEYVSEQISGKLPLWLRNWVESGHEEFLSLFPERRGNIFKNLRFIILDQQNNTCLVGILTRSTDSIGRQFPATFFAQVPINIFSDLTYLPVITGPIWRLLENTPPEEMEKGYEAVFGELKKRATRTKIYIQSLLPTCGKRYGKYNKDVIFWNKKLPALAKKYGFEYLDIAPAFRDKNGYLRKDITKDGLHLNEKGYKIWAGILKKYL